MTEPLRLVQCGDRSVLVYLGESIDPAVNDRVHALARAIRQAAHPAVTEVVPAYHCVMVEYDPVRIRPEQVQELIRSASTSGAGADSAGRTVEIPVHYGDDAGPDLANVAGHTGLSTAEVIDRHAQGRYRVYCLGFSPGFPYLGGLNPSLNTPRLADPRTRVPAGSVAIGGGQTGIYPNESPGGWQLIGRTPLALFDPLRLPPTLLEPGDHVRFVPIDEAAYMATLTDMETGGGVRPQTANDKGSTGLRILNPGLATTVQDLGRRGYMQYGVPVGGAADFTALMVGNWLLGNRARTSGLEITVLGPEVEFTGPVAFCLTGAPLPAELVPAGGGPSLVVPGWTTVLAGPGDRLRTGSTTLGCRAYLCVAGGIDLPPVLGSLSEDLFAKIGPLGRLLKAGDWLPLGLPIHPPANLAGRQLPADMVPAYENRAVIRAMRGPQADAFTEHGLAAFFGGEYRVGAQSDRQGLRLEGPKVAHRGSADILSEPIAAGSVQVPASGQPIILLGNRQTVGGYTKAAVAMYADLAVASQLRPGDKLSFQEVDAAEAHAIAWAERRKLAQMRRYLEREISTAPETMGRAAVIAVQRPSVEVAPDPTPVAVYDAPSVADQAPAPIKAYRITICGIEFETTVEEVAD